MAYGDIHAGYQGIAAIGGLGNVRFSDANITVRQTVEAPDLVMGDWAHDAYVYGKIEIGGSINGPVTENFGGTLWQWATERTGCGYLSARSVDLQYYCGQSRSFPNVVVNSIGFSCAAGEIAQFNVDVMGYDSSTAWGSSSDTYTDYEKLLTWDKVTVALNPGDENFTVPANIAYSNFDFTLSNNVTAQYSLGQPNLYPFDIVPGLVTITGTISAYDVPHADGVESWDDYAADGVGTCIFNIGATTITMRVRFHRVEPSAAPGPIVSTIGFTGVGQPT